ncbi:MAG: ArsA family ATPase [Cyanobacteria bacterium P01_H01_bin.15]
MAQIITFLGPHTGNRRSVAVAAAQSLAQSGHRVLLTLPDIGPVPTQLLPSGLTTEPTEIAPNLQALKLSATSLLTQSWEEVKALEAQYLRSPFLKNVFGQELGILPGMSDALALNALRIFDQSGDYDVIVFEGGDSFHALRMWAIPETFSWYIRRFQKLFLDSDVGKTLGPFIQPISAAVLNVSWSADSLFQSAPASEGNELLGAGRKALADPQRVVAYLVSNADADAIAETNYLWGSAQQVGLHVGGALVLGSPDADAFAPLTVTSLPESGSVAEITAALPNLRDLGMIPSPLDINVAERRVKIFLPGFTKQQVKLTQSGPELTIEAGGQRRNLSLPKGLSGQSITGAKFEAPYLLITF